MKNFLTLFFIISFLNLQAQLDESCKLEIGTNLSGLVDYSIELPFVDLMHNARQWYTKDIGNPTNPFDTGNAARLALRPDGYPTHVPQPISLSPYDQSVATIWSVTDGWPAGEYTVLWEGTGELSFSGGYENLEQTNPNRIVFDFLTPMNDSLEMVILASDINDPIRNIRVLMPGTEATYETEPFYSLWLEKLSIFSSVRFMDWGKTNNWGKPNLLSWDDPSLIIWEDRAQMNHYTWATNKGIPYEMMIKLLNDYDLDGWVCVPHSASDEYIENMATLFKDSLVTERHLTVEYSNEIWNIHHGQTRWLREYGGGTQNITSWPEKAVPNVQNCLDTWTGVFENELDRISRVVGLGEFFNYDIVTNLTTGSFDAVSPNFYFKFTEAGQASLLVLGENATVKNVAARARQGMEVKKNRLETQRNDLADIGVEVPMVFYEGGQHLTGFAYGGQALLDIQRDTSMYNMYQEWFDFLRTFQEGDVPLKLMHFSFVAERNAQDGSWGIFESMNQDTTEIPAPKYAAILDAMAACDLNVSTTTTLSFSEKIKVYPNPTNNYFYVESDDFEIETVSISEWTGREIIKRGVSAKSFEFQIPSNLANGVYVLKLKLEDQRLVLKKIVIR